MYIRNSYIDVMHLDVNCRVSKDLHHCFWTQLSNLRSKLEHRPTTPRLDAAVSSIFAKYPNWLWTQKS